MSGINTKITWKNKEIIIGKKQKVLINQLVGTNHASDYSQALEKIDMWDNDPQAPAIITDVSLANSSCNLSIWEYALQKNNYIVGTVPIYFVKNKENIDPQELLTIIENQLAKGVKIITIHPTPTQELITLSKKRITPTTSRGGGIIIHDLLRNQRKENVYLTCLDAIADLCKKYHAVLSIGTTFRSANIIDSMDAVQKAEIRMQIKLAELLYNKEVTVILEMPGHASPEKIKELNQILKDCPFPIMPLGPIVTDVGVGMDHITAAIGVTLMGLDGNVQIISAVTREEHTGSIPSIQSTKEAILTARLAAHIIDMEQLHDYSSDYQYAIARKKSCIIGNHSTGCSRCGEYCPLK